MMEAYAVNSTLECDLVVDFLSTPVSGLTPERAIHILLASCSAPNERNIMSFHAVYACKAEDETILYATDFLIAEKSSVLSRILSRVPGRRTFGSYIVRKAR